jgi:hypothetical protein
MISMIVREAGNYQTGVENGGWNILMARTPPEERPDTMAGRWTTPRRNSFKSLPQMLYE